jgi:hypothetical protein
MRACLHQPALVHYELQSSVPSAHLILSSDIRQQLSISNFCHMILLMELGVAVPKRYQAWKCKGTRSKTTRALP